MSYDVGLYHSMTCSHCGETIASGTLHEVDPHAEGGIQVLYGSTDAELNITYNYSVFFSEHLGGLTSALEGRRADDTIPLLEKAVSALGTERDPDYWAATPGNAGHALSILLEWAKKYPGGVWRVW